MVPQQQVTLPPAAVTHYFLRRRPVDKLVFALRGLSLPSALRRGGWDRGLAEVTQHPVYQLMAAFLRYDFDPDACHDPLVRDYIARGEDSGSAQEHAQRRLASYLAEYRALASDMRDNGYRPEASADQVGVAIDRQGGFVKVAEGHHRFALARLLGLDAMTAEIRFVHWQWYRRFATGHRRFSPKAFTEAVETATHWASQHPPSSSG